MKLATTLAALVLPLLAMACPPAVDGRPEGRCFADCEARAKRCADHECARGCRFVIDRIVEREDQRVVACVAAASTCGDDTWAHCAVRVGVHADGGPPNPAPIRPDDTPEGEKEKDDE